MSLAHGLIGRRRNPDSHIRPSCAGRDGKRGPGRLDRLGSRHSFKRNEGDCTDRILSHLR
jgi:hypothetical protein